MVTPIKHVQLIVGSHL
uniref:Uncharacterized protein n=1 Tax=Rhizophora mucronata TaxID=61149 RepID=A0A2P2QAB8_RHIMU